MEIFLLIVKFILCALAAFGIYTMLQGFFKLHETHRKERR